MGLINTKFLQKNQNSFKVLRKIDKILPSAHHYSNSLLYCGMTGDISFSTGIFLSIMDR
jgi:hypothetical protein